MEYTNIQQRLPTTTPGSKEQIGIHIYSTNGHKRTPDSNEQYEIHKYSINGHKRTPGSNEQYIIQ